MIYDICSHKLRKWVLIVARWYIISDDWYDWYANVAISYFLLTHSVSHSFISFSQGTNKLSKHDCSVVSSWRSLIAKFMGPTWGPPGSCRPQMGPMSAPWNLLSGMTFQNRCAVMLTPLLSAAAPWTRQARTSSPLTFRWRSYNSMIIVIRVRSIRHLQRQPLNCWWVGSRLSYHFAKCANYVPLLICLWSVCRTNFIH